MGAHPCFTISEAIIFATTSQLSFTNSYRSRSMPRFGSWSPSRSQALSGPRTAPRAFCDRRSHGLFPLGYSGSGIKSCSRSSPVLLRLLDPLALGGKEIPPDVAPAIHGFAAGEQQAVRRYCRDLIWPACSKISRRLFSAGGHFCCLGLAARSTRKEPKLV